MNLSELFPSYPIQVISPRKANVKIASRKVYVDFPYVFWNFIGEVALELARSKSPQEIFKKRLQLFNSDEEIKRIITFNDSPLGSISLTAHPFTTKLLLKLRVNWRTFFQYLDDKARKLVERVELDGSNIKEVYNEIADNYFKIAPFVPDPEKGRFNIYELEKFKKLLRRLNEEQSIRRSLSEFRRIIKSIEKSVGVEGIKLWTLQLESDIYGVEKCLENVDILACYFYLRNALENFIKLVIYNDVAKNIGFRDEMLRVLFFYEKVAGDRCWSIQEVKKKYVRRITRYLLNIKEIDLEKMYFMMISKRFPKLSINRQTIEEFQKSYNIDVPIKNYWSACSEVIHNQSPLPFFSLLEVKAFNYFLKRYVGYFLSMVKTIFNVKAKDIAGEEIVHEQFSMGRVLSKKGKCVLRQLISNEDLENILESLIDNKALRKEVFFNPLTLLSLFHLSTPGLKRIFSGEFDINDIDYIISKIQPWSFPRGGLRHEFYKTLHILEEKLKPYFHKASSNFSELNDEEKKAVIFYFLAIKLPQIFQS